MMKKLGGKKKKHIGSEPVEKTEKAHTYSRVKNQPSIRSILRSIKLQTSLKLSKLTGIAVKHKIIKSKNNSK